MELRLPTLGGPEMEYATVTGWLKGEGDRVAVDEPIVEVEAEKANHEIAAPVGGLIREILAVEGDEVQVGSVLAIIEEEG